MEKEKIKALLIKVGEEPKPFEVENHFRAMQNVVAGNIEFYQVDDRINAILNEEGKLIGLEGNRLIGNDIICGDFLIVGDDGYGETISLTENQLKKYTEKFKTPLEFTPEQVQDNIMVRVLPLDEFQDFIDPRPIPVPKKKSKGMER